MKEDAKFKIVESYSFGKIPLPEFLRTEFLFNCRDANKIIP